MRIEIALCQTRPVPGDPARNAETVANAIVSDSANVLVYPECFLTGYGVRPEGIADEIDSGLSKILDMCRKYDKAVAVGTAMMTERGPTNTLAFLSPDGESYYDKAHLAKFGIYAEEGFVAGSKPGMGSYHGIRFGLSICYDIYFPEVLHGCSLRRADVNLCVSAAAVQSASCFDKVLPARALENVTYLAYVNNVGPMGDLTMAGGSRAYTPMGDVIVECGGDGECVERFTADTEALFRYRDIRRHLTDFRGDVDWLGLNHRGARARDARQINYKWELSFPHPTSRDGPAR